LEDSSADLFVFGARQSASDEQPETINQNSSPQSISNIDTSNTEVNISNMNNEHENTIDVSSDSLEESSVEQSSSTVEDQSTDYIQQIEQNSQINNLSNSLSPAVTSVSVTLPEGDQVRTRRPWRPRDYPCVYSDGTIPVSQRT
jgi:hypothetical protein